jgi:shikimate dehydrogenase
MAAALARHAVADRGWPHVQVASAGTGRAGRLPASPQVPVVLREKGIDPGPHEASELTPELVDWADAILVMGPSAPGCGGSAGWRRQGRPGHPVPARATRPGRPVADPIGATSKSTARPATSWNGPSPPCSTGSSPSWRPDRAHGHASGTRLIALLGDPVDHSLSPRFQNAAIRAAGLDAVYVALRCDADHLPGCSAGSPPRWGGNVTIPHKERAALLEDEATEAVDRTGACNTFWVEGGRLHGDNTDVEGFAAAARRSSGPRPAPGCWSWAPGGALAPPSSPSCAPRRRGPRPGRSPDREPGLCQDLDPGGPPRERPRPPPPPPPRGYDLIVNATSPGLEPDDDSPSTWSARPRGAVLDLAYHPDHRLGPGRPGPGHPGRRWQGDAPASGRRRVPPLVPPGPGPGRDAPGPPLTPSHPAMAAPRPPPTHAPCPFSPACSIWSSRPAAWGAPARRATRAAGLRAVRPAWWRRRPRSAPAAGSHA